MRKIELNRFSDVYQIRKMTTEDVPDILAFCKANVQYYRYCGKQPTKELIEQDLSITPPNTSPEQKYYVGFFDGETLMAVMDLIDGYPTDTTAFIGFFMMNSDFQGKGLGSQMMRTLFSYLAELGFETVSLGIDKGNPQSTHFWKKNGFQVIREVAREDGFILVAERRIKG